jgi:dihydroorotase
MRLYNVRVLSRDGISPPTTIHLPVDDAADRDASGLILSPGFMDLHAHLRDPGYPEKETLASGAASAAFGGFTHIVAMANTNPVTDTPERLQQVVGRAGALPVRLSFVGALTVGLQGRALTDIAGLRVAGAVALSDDGRHAMEASLLRRALQGGG